MRGFRLSCASHHFVVVSHTMTTEDLDGFLQKNVKKVCQELVQHLRRRLT